MEVHCDWLSPPHVAKLPVVVHEPFVYSHQEHTAGERYRNLATFFHSLLAHSLTLPPSLSSFLQLTMQNSSPISLQVTEHTLSNSIDLVPLYGTLPEVRRSSVYHNIDFTYLCRYFNQGKPFRLYGSQEKVRVNMITHVHAYIML